MASLKELVGRYNDANDKAFNRYLKRYEAFAAKQDSGSATESEATLASEEADD